MKEIITIQNQGAELVADSRDIAKLFGIEHESIREHIESHQEQLEQLGIFRFETGKIKGRGRPEKYFFLNFDQIAYVLTLTRSNEKTKEFRLRLILAFRDARERLRPVDSLLLSIPEQWKITFKDDFYVALLKLYGDSFDKSKNRPSWVGGWTNRFIYEPIFIGLSNELKTKRKIYCESKDREEEWIKMHQFLEMHAKQELREHIAKITTLLYVSATRQDFRESFAKVFHGHDQLKFLMEDLKEDYGA